MNIGTKLTLNAIGLCSILIGLFSYLSYNEMRQLYDIAEEKEMKAQHRVILNQMLNETKKAEAFSSLLANIPAVQEAFAKRQREELQKLLMPSFEIMQKKYAIQQFHFHLAGLVEKGETAGQYSNAVSFLRFHQPEKYGDDLSNRKIIVATNVSQRQQKGFTREEDGLSIRAVTPMFYQQEHTGSVEFGMKFNTEFLKAEYGIDFALYVARQPKEGEGVKFFNFARTFESSLDSKHDLYLLDNNELSSILTTGHRYITPKIINNKPVVVYSDIFTDFSKKVIAVLSVIIDRTDYLEAMEETQKLILNTALIALLVISIIFFISGQMMGKLISKVAKAMEEIANGNLNFEMCSTRRRDEIGMIQRAVMGMSKSMKDMIDDIQTTVTSVQNGDLTKRVNTSKLSGFMRALGDTTNQSVEVTCALQELTERNAKQDWLKTGQTKLNEQMSGTQRIEELAGNVITFLCNYLEDVQVGAFYLVTKANHLQLFSTYAYTKRKQLANEFEFGEGLVGQAALEKQSIVITQAPEDYIQVQSGIGESVPRNLLVIPFFYEDELTGVIEMASLQEVSDIQLEFIEQVMPHVGIAMNTAQSRTKLQSLLKKEKAV
ncbi:cache domain-containing protein [Candidatus Halobeggiatoa sp. HSG11]|nr:cache domain-containing protein [Candidatus Halobeggiatoa sp. HSG11]